MDGCPLKEDSPHPFVPGDRRKTHLLRTYIQSHAVHMEEPTIITMVAVLAYAVVVAVRLSLLLGTMTAVVLGSHAATGDGNHHRRQQTQTISQPRSAHQKQQLRCKITAFCRNTQYLKIGILPIVGFQRLAEDDHRLAQILFVEDIRHTYLMTAVLRVGIESRSRRHHDR